MYAIKNVTPANIVVLILSRSLQLCFPTSMLIAEVGEPPEVAKSNGESEAGEEEVALVAPGTPLCLLLVLRVPCPSFFFTFPHVLSSHDMSQTLGIRLRSFGFLLVCAQCPPNALPCPSEPQYDIVEHRRACPSKHYNT